MSNDKMPEKIWAEKRDYGNVFVLWSDPDGTEYIRADGETITDLQRKNAALKEQLAAQTSRAQIAREFCDQALARIESHEWNFQLSCDETLQQWEAAEVTDAETK